MATWDDVERIALSLPLVEERAGGGYDGWRTWKIAGSRGRQVVWERPLRDSDLRALAAERRTPPEGPLVAVRTADMDAKAQTLRVFGACLDIPHFARYTGVLVRLDDVEVDGLQELVEESWLAVAPARARRDWLVARAGG